MNKPNSSASSSQLEKSAEGSISVMNISYSTTDGSEEPPEHIIINITAHDNNKVDVKICQHAFTRSVLESYAEKRGLYYAYYKFYLHGEYFDSKKTTFELGLMENDTIDAYFPVQGGSCIR